MPPDHQPTRRALLAMVAGLLAATSPPEPATLDLYGGGVLALDQLRGRVVILNFWATWCAPCRQELAEIDLLVAGSRGRLAAVAMLAERRPDERILKAQAAALRMPVALRFVAGGRRFPLANSAVPTTYLLDRAGGVALVKAGAFAPGELATRLRPLLDSLGG